LKSREHVATTQRFALLEYRFARAPTAAAGEEGQGAVASGDAFGLGAGAGVGSQERGRTIFEGLLAAAPRRLDVWSVFLDAEVAALAAARAAATAAAPSGKGKSTAAARAAAASDLAGVRHLFARALAQRLSSKKARFLLRKAAAFERVHGDEAGLQRVAQAAREYAERHGGGAAAGAEGGRGEEEEEEEEDN